MSTLLLFANRISYKDKGGMYVNIQKQQVSISFDQLISLIEKTPFAQKLPLSNIANDYNLTAASFLAILRYLAEKDSVDS